MVYESTLWLTLALTTMLQPIYADGFSPYSSIVFENKCSEASARKINPGRSNGALSD
jgi:hypothetical protein